VPGERGKREDPREAVSVGGRRCAEWTQRPGVNDPWWLMRENGRKFAGPAFDFDEGVLAGAGSGELRYRPMCLRPR